MRDTHIPDQTNGQDTPRRPREETARLGKEMYERDIRPLLESDHHGEIVAIDVDSGRWAVADGEVAAVNRLRELRPNAVNVLCERVGYRALRSFGAGPRTQNADLRLAQTPHFFNKFKNHQQNPTNP